MKQIAITLLSMIPLFAFNACDKRDDIQADVDALNARLDSLDTQLDALNTSINTFYEVAVLQDAVLITDYTMDENGDYTLILSNDSTLTIYGGMPADDIPVVGIDSLGYWTYTIDGETEYLTDEDGEPISALPTDGRDGTVPSFAIIDGRWYYTVDDGVTYIEIEGYYGYASIEDIPAGIFATVVESEDGKTLMITLSSGGATYEISVLGGLGMTLSVDNVEVISGGSVTLTAILTNVAEVIIDPSVIEVQLEETSTSDTDGEHIITITVPSDVDAGTYTVYFQIFSAVDCGYRMIIPLTVTVTD